MRCDCSCGSAGRGLQGLFFFFGFKHYPLHKLETQYNYSLVHSFVFRFLLPLTHTLNQRATTATTTKS